MDGKEESGEAATRISNHDVLTTRHSEQEAYELYQDYGYTLGFNFRKEKNYYYVKVKQMIERGNQHVTIHASDPSIIPSQAQVNMQPTISYFAIPRIQSNINQEKYKAASGSDTVEGLEVTSRMAPFNVTAWTEATRGTQKGKIRGLGNYMTSTKMLPQSLRTPSAMGNQSHSFTSQPPYAGLGTDVGYHEEVTELRHQMSQI